MGDLDIRIRHGGGGGVDPALILYGGVCLAVIAGAVALVEAVEAVPVYVWVLAVAAVSGGATWAVKVGRRRTRRKHAERTAWREAVENADKARWAVERERKHQRALEVAAAGRPVIENHINLSADDIAAALFRQQPAPVTRQEIPR